MELRALQAKRRELIVTFEVEPGQEELLHIAYAPHKYTSKTHLDMSMLGNTGDAEALARVLSSILLDWDLTDNKEPVPISSKGIIDHGVPFMLQLEVSKAITKDMNDQKNAPRSSAS